MSGPAAPSESLGHSLRLIAFRNLFASATASAVGGAVSSVAISWIVYHATHSTLDIALVGVAGFVPGILLGFLSGVLADRYNRRSLMVTADLVRMAAMGLLAVSLYWAGFSLLLIVAVLVVVNAFGSLFTPASQAILPRLVPKGSLEDANGLLQGTTAVMISLGSALGGVIVAFAGAVWGLGLNALTYAASAIFVFQIAGSLGLPRVLGETRSSSFRREFSEGIGYMRAHRPILEVTLAFLPANFLFTLVVGFVVVYSTARFGANPTIYGSLAAVEAAGTAAGALVVGRIRARRFAGVLMGGCILGQGAGAALLAVSHSVVLSLLASAVLGLGIGLVNTVYYATMQAIVPGELLARVLSIDSVGAFAAVPAGFAVGGVIASRYGIGLTFLVAAIGLLVNGVAALSLPGFRSMRYEG